MIELQVNEKSKSIFVPETHLGETKINIKIHNGIY